MVEQGLPVAQPDREKVIARLTGMSASAYQLAMRVAGSTERAEDSVQQAYLKALRHLRTGPSPSIFAPGSCGS